MLSSTSPKKGDKANLLKPEYFLSKSGEGANRKQEQKTIEGESTYVFVLRRDTKGKG